MAKSKLTKDCEAFLKLWDEYWHTGAFQGPPWEDLNIAAEKIREHLKEKKDVRP
jgi:hypothetical protein